MPEQENVGTSAFAVKRVGISYATQENVEASPYDTQRNGKHVLVYYTNKTCECSCIPHSKKAVSFY